MPLQRVATRAWGHLTRLADQSPQISGRTGHVGAQAHFRPVLVALGEWGLCWARHTVLDEELDIEMLMLYLERAVDPEHLVGNETIIRFKFTDLAEQKDYWLLVKDRKTELCLRDPGKDINVYFTCTLRTMHDVWMGERTYRDAISSGDLNLQGDPALTRNVRAWLRPSIFEKSAREPAPA